MRRWEELRGDLDAWDVRLVTLSTDTPQQTRTGMSKHGAQATMLSDPSLSLIRALGLENTAPKVRPPGVAGLAIPTSILIDADHIVRWIDQATDYQVRTAPERVRAALIEGLGESARVN